MMMRMALADSPCAVDCSMMCLSNKGGFSKGAAGIPRAPACVHQLYARRSRVGGSAATDDETAAAGRRPADPAVGRQPDRTWRQVAGGDRNGTGPGEGGAAAGERRLSGLGIRDERRGAQAAGRSRSRRGAGAVGESESVPGGTHTDR